MWVDIVCIKAPKAWRNVGGLCAKRRERPGEECGRLVCRKTGKGLEKSVGDSCAKRRGKAWRRVWVDCVQKYAKGLERSEGGEKEICGPMKRRQ